MYYPLTGALRRNNKRVALINPPLGIKPSLEIETKTRTETETDAETEKETETGTGTDAETETEGRGYRNLWKVSLHQRPNFKLNLLTQPENNPGGFVNATRGLQRPSPTGLQ